MFKQTLVTQVAQRLLELPDVVFVVETGQRREPGGVCTAGKNQQRSAFGPGKAALTPSQVAWCCDPLIGMFLILPSDMLPNFVSHMKIAL